MYSFSKSLLEPVGEYRVEVYSMGVLSHDVSVDIELKIFGEGDSESYIAEYEITRADGKTTGGACMNRGTKENTFVAVEESVIQAMEDENHHWK